MKLPKLPKLKFSSFSYRSYVRHLRRQSVRIQQIHAFVFATVLTTIAAVYILYYDYGFWHDVYIQKTEANDLVSQTTVMPEQSPTQVLSHFFEEAKQRFGSIGSDTTAIFERKDVYTNTDTTTP